MRYFLLVPALIFVRTCGYCQKQCPFPYESIISVDSITSLRLLDTIKDLQLTSYKKTGKMPACIRKAMNCIFDGRFSIARVGGPYSGGCSQSWWKPIRQLIYLGVNDHYMLITYKKGGGAPSRPMLLFHYDKKKINAVWYWRGVYDIKTKEDIHKAFLGYPWGEPFPVRI